MAMAAVVISIFLIGGSVMALYCFIENVLLEQNRKLWEKWEKSLEEKRSA